MPRPQARLTRGLMNSPIQIRSEAAASLRSLSAVAYCGQSLWRQRELTAAALDRRGHFTPLWPGAPTSIGL